MAIGIVETKFGKLQGVELEGKYKGITVFRGVPFAAPPVGELRWKLPMDPEPWEGVRLCDKDAPMAAQQLVYDDIEGSRLTDEDFYFDGHPPMDEDCLYLNIYTPAQSADERHAVYMWLHGGGLTNGFPYEAEVDPVELVKRGIVVVQVAQRLNGFGYLAIPQLTEEQGCSGNYGMYDEVKALDWVYDNIAAFGGDPENISAGGQSGGSFKATTLALSPLAKGRVKHVIAQSWILWMMRYLTQEETENIGREYLKLLGIDPDATLEMLRGIEYTRLLSKNVPRPLVPGDMMCDGKVIDCATQRESFDIYGGGVDFLGGTNLGEAEVFQPAGLPKYFFPHYAMPTGLGFESEDKIENTRQFYEHFKKLLGDLYDKYDFENLVKVTDENCWFTARKLATLGLTNPGKDGMAKTVMMHRLFGMHMTKKFPGHRTYVYLWTHIQPVRPEDHGTYRDPERLLAWHSSELWYVFNSMREGIPPTRPWTKLDYELAEKLCDYWANFMKTGDPNGPGLPYWPKAGDNYGYMDLGDEFVAYEGADEGLDALMKEFICTQYDITL